MLILLAIISIVQFLFQSLGSGTLIGEEFQVEGNVVIIVAQPFEARAAVGVGRGMSKEKWGAWTLYRGDMWDMPYAVIRCGPGKVAAAAAAQAAIQYLEPEVLISFGVAGSPMVSVPTGRLLVASQVRDVALSQLKNLPIDIPCEFQAPGELARRFSEVPGVEPGIVLCWEGRVASPSQIPPGMPETGVHVAVDWESSAVAQIGQMWDVPWAVFKVISDHGERDRLKRLAVVARRPLQWAAEVMRRGCAAYLAGEGENLGAGT